MESGEEIIEKLAKKNVSTYFPLLRKKQFIRKYDFSNAKILVA